MEGSPSKFSARVERLAAGLHVLLASPSPAAAKPSRLRQAQRRLTSEQVGQLVEEYRAGDSMKALAARWALHRSTVAGHLRHAGVQLRRQGLSEEQLREGVRLYTEGWSLQRLAERYWCDAETVRTHLTQAGLNMRRPWERG